MLSAHFGTTAHSSNPAAAFCGYRPSMNITVVLDRRTVHPKLSYSLVHDCGEVDLPATILGLASNHSFRCKGHRAMPQCLKNEVQQLQ